MHVCIISLQYFFVLWHLEKISKKAIKKGNKELMDEQMLKQSPSSVRDMFSITSLNSPLGTVLAFLYKVLRAGLPFRLLSTSRQGRTGCGPDPPPPRPG